ncbi:hypothetical protein JCM9279_002722 [Rhodotorula babjevae]
MHFLAALSTLIATLALAQAAPVTSFPSGQRVDRASLVAANRARLSSFLSESSVSAASVASVGSVAARQSSMSSVRNAIVSSNRAKQSAYVSSSRAAAAAAASATAAPTPSGFVTVPASQRPTPTPSVPASSSSTASANLPRTTCALDDVMCWQEVQAQAVIIGFVSRESEYQATCTGGKAHGCSGPHAQPTTISASRSSVATTTTTRA